MNIVIKQGSDLNKDQKGDLAMLIRQFDTFAPQPRDPKTLLPFESIFEMCEVHPRNFRFFNISGPNTYFLMYDENERCVATAAVILTVTSRKAQVTIEDVIVDNRLRGKGVGNELMKAVIDWVKQQNMFYFIQLTCSPKRGKWVNQWFIDLGFELVACPHPDKTGPHSTNLYRLSLMDR